MAPSGRGSSPFIMPDGRPLGAFLSADGNRAGADSTRNRGTKANKARKNSASMKWEKSFRAVPSSNVASGGPRSEADVLELEAISKVGRERRRRWLNDKILRDMAGSMTAADMDLLFKPPPFGGAMRPSVMAQAALPANMPLWDLFRNIDMEKQHRVLLRWEQHIAEQRHAAGGSADVRLSPALEALRAWARTGRKARDALRRAGLEVVHALEARMLRFMFEDATAAVAESCKVAVLPPQPQPLAATDSSISTPLQLADPHATEVAADSPTAGTAAAVSPDATAPAAAAASYPATEAVSSGNVTGSADTDASLTSPATTATAASPAVGIGQAGSPANGNLRPLRSPSALRGGSPPPSNRSVAELAFLLPDGFHRLLVHGLAQFHGLASFSRDIDDEELSGGEPVQLPGRDVVEADRITIVRRPMEEPARSPDDEVITVADILLVMDQQGTNDITAAMLELPGTPLSEMH